MTVDDIRIKLPHKTFHAANKRQQAAGSLGVERQRHRGQTEFARLHDGRSSFETGDERLVSRLLDAQYCFAPGDTQAMAERMVQALNEDWRAGLARVCVDRIFKGGLRLEDFLEASLNVYDRAIYSARRTSAS